MSDAINRGLAMAIALAPLLVACGGGNASNPSAINTPQCSGSSCPVQGPPPQGTVAPLCPATAEIGNSTYLGGAGSGEVVSLNINATAMTYSLTWLQSPIPLHTGEVTPTRTGVTITGAVAHPPTGALPTAEQIRCAFILTPGTGTASVDGSTYSTASTFNQTNPPMVLIGLGVAGGGIPGASVQYNGFQPTAAVLGSQLSSLLGINLFPVAARNFDFYPFLGFASVDTNLADMNGEYNALFYHLQPSNKYATTASTAQESFDGAGNCSLPSGASNSQCELTGGTWTAVSGASYFTSADAPRLMPGPSLAGLYTFPIAASANMVLGKLNGQVIPLIVRTGDVNPNNFVVDDESGIAMLAPATQIQSGAINGGYVGADSNFDYTATLLEGAGGSFVNPGTSSAESQFALDYTQQHIGLINVTDTNGKTGNLISAGGLYAIFINGEENGGVTASSANSDTLNYPYFGIGAQISK